MFEEAAKNYLADALKSFRAYKKLAEGAFEQVSDEDFFRMIDAESNSVAVIVKHIAGNMISRWTDFLTSDGEKPNRQRDMEFVITEDATRAAMLDYWERGWTCVFEALEPLEPEDLTRVVLIRGQKHTVVEAINRQMTHYAYHVGQIVFLCKHFKSAEWKTLSIPRNRSLEFDSYLASRPKNDAAQQHRFETAQDFVNEVQKSEKR